MKANRTRGIRKGPEVSRSPIAEEMGKGGFPAQKQDWPGHGTAMRPRPDHGEETYRGAGKLKDMTALITGGDSGIGRAVAIAFAREGADVAIAYFDEHDDARETVGWIEKAGRKALAVPGDLMDRDHCFAVAGKTAKELGRVGILVNNAAIHFEKRDFLKLTPEQIDRTFRTNIYSFIWMTQAVIGKMREGDSIINTGSVTGMSGHPSLIDYAATKAAIHNFTKSLAVNVADRGIRVNCVAPGPVWTPLIVSTRGSGHSEDFGTDTLWKRAAQPAEIAPSYVFLSSADSRYYTGEILAPTGKETTSR